MVVLLIEELGLVILTILHFLFAIVIGISGIWMLLKQNV